MFAVPVKVVSFNLKTMIHRRPAGTKLTDKNIITQALHRKQIFRIFASRTSYAEDITIAHGPFVHA
jgi:hypothetical protein